MTTKVMKSQVIDSLKLALKVADRKGLLPTSQKMRISATNGYLFCTSVQGDTAAYARMPCNGDGIPEMVVDARKFVQAVDECAKRRRGRSSPDVEIEIQHLDNSLYISGNDGGFEVAGTGDEWPADELMTGAMYNYNGKALGKALSFVVPAISQDETRFQLCSLLLSTDGQMVATDGARLHRAEDLTSIAKDVILPFHAADILSRAVKAFEPEDVTACFNDSRARFTISVGGGAFHVTTKLGDRFPPYQHVIPAIASFGVQVNREAALTATRTAQKMAPRFARPSINLFSTPDETTMAVKYEDIPEVKFGIPSAHNGLENFIRCLDANYLGDALKGFEEGNVTMDGDQYHLAPVTMREGNLLAVIMPINPA